LIKLNKVSSKDVKYKCSVAKFRQSLSKSSTIEKTRIENWSFVSVFQWLFVGQVLTNTFFQYLNNISPKANQLQNRIDPKTNNQETFFFKSENLDIKNQMYPSSIICMYLNHQK
jgi:hypothetical protein